MLCCQHPASALMPPDDSIHTEVIPASSNRKLKRLENTKMTDHKIEFRYLSQEDLIDAGCFDMPMCLEATERSFINYAEGNILFPDKIVQIFDEKTQDRINCLPATLMPEKICGVKWVSVFPGNPVKYGTQNLSAIIVLSEIEKGYPVCVMDGTLCSNIRVACVGATAAKYLSRQDSETIGFIGAGEQAKMHLIGMKSVRPSLKTCKVSAKFAEEEKNFIANMQPLFPDMKFIACDTNLEKAIRESDICVTAVSCQAPLLKAAWIDKNAGVFYSHIGGWEDEYENVVQADKIVCDSWNVVKHRTQTVSRAFQQGLISDDKIHADLVDIITGKKCGRENDREYIYFNAVGLSYIDVTLAYTMFCRAASKGAGRMLPMQEKMIFEHDLSGKIRL